MEVVAVEAGDTEVDVPREVLYIEAVVDFVEEGVMKNSDDCMTILALAAIDTEPVEMW